LDAVTFLTYSIVVITAPERVNDGEFALSIPRTAEHFGGVIVTVVAVAVAAEMLFFGIGFHFATSRLLTTGLRL
jgi:hypothetical protein